MAKQFLDFWQEQASRGLTDKTFVKVMLDMMQQMPQFGRHGASSQHASVSPESRSFGLAECAERLAAIEKRLARLERADDATPARSGAKRSKAKAKRLAKRR